MKYFLVFACGAFVGFRFAFAELRRVDEKLAALEEDAKTFATRMQVAEDLQRLERDLANPR